MKPKTFSMPTKTKPAQPVNAQPQPNQHNAAHAPHAKTGAAKPFKPKSC